MYFMEITDLSKSQVREINATIDTLQKDISLAQSNLKSRNFSGALKHITNGINHTDCPLCKEKLSALAIEINNSKQGCDDDSNECSLLIGTTLQNAESLKNEFVPLATEKSMLKAFESFNPIRDGIKMPVKLADKILNL